MGHPFGCPIVQLIVRGQQLNRFTHFLDCVYKAVQVITSILMVILFVVVILGVFSRYIFQNPFVWTEELALFLLSWMVFLGSSQLIRKWENVRVTYFIEKFSVRVSRINDLIIKLLVIVFMGYVLILSITIIPKVGPTEQSPALGLPMTIPQMSIIFGFSLMFLQMSGVLLEWVAGYLKKKE